MPYTFSRRDFLKYSALTAVAVAGAGLLSGCEVQDPNNPVFKKLGVGGTLGTTGGCLDAVEIEGTEGVFTFSVKNSADALLDMNPNSAFSVKVLDADGNKKWGSSFDLKISAVAGSDGSVANVLPNLPANTEAQYKIYVPGYAAKKPEATDTLVFKFIPRSANQSELSLNWEISGADLVGTDE